MSTRPKWILATALAGILVALPALAETPQEKEDVKEMTAEIVDFDVETNTLTVKRMDAEIDEPLPSNEYSAEKKKLKEEDKEITVTITDETRITEDGGKMIALSGLKAGERVNVRYKEADDGTLEILGIVVYTTTT